MTVIMLNVNLKKYKFCSFELLAGSLVRIDHDCYHVKSAVVVFGGIYGVFSSRNGSKA